jgi:hypothetical protein
MDLKIGVAFRRLLTKAYLDIAKEKFRSVAEKGNRNVPCHECALVEWSWTSRLVWLSAGS